MGRILHLKYMRILHILKNCEVLDIIAPTWQASGGFAVVGHEPLTFQVSANSGAAPMVGPPCGPLKSSICTEL